MGALIFTIFMFSFKKETLGKNQPKVPEKSFLRRWGTACLAALAISGYMSQKPLNAEEITGKEVITNSREFSSQPKLLDDTQLEFLKSAPTIEEQDALAKLRIRLDGIASKRVLSTPEIKSSAQIIPDSTNGLSMSGLEVVESKTNAYFLDKEQNKYNDIITENTTTQINIGVQKNTTKVTNELPFTKGYQTTENIVLLQNEDGSYSTLFKHRPGYIKSDGTLDTTVNQSLGGHVNKPQFSNFERDSVVTNDVIDEIRKPGQVSRDFFNTHGYVVQGKAFEEPSKLKTSIERKNEESIAITIDTTLKHTSSTEHKSVIRESFRSVGYTSNASKEANLGLNLLVGVFKSPLSKPLDTAKTQSETRVHTKSTNDSKNTQPKPAMIHSPEVLEELQLEQLALRENIRPSILESRLSALKDQKRGSFVGIDVGTKEVVRAKFANEVYRTEDSKFINQYRVGAESDTDNTITKLEVNGEQPIKNAVVGLYSSLDYQHYSFFNNQTVTTHRQSELSTGVNGGIKSGPVIGSARIAVNHDQLDNITYPSVQSRLKIGGDKHNIQSQANYSTNPGISNLNQVVLSANTTINTGKKSAISLSAKQTLDLGGNTESYKTRSTLGLAANLGGKVEVSSEYYLGSGNSINENGALENGKSDKGYLLQTVVRQNWGAVFANISKVNETKKIGLGVVAKIKENTTAELNFSHQKGYGEFNNNDTVLFKIRKNW
jgi:hypothetical protein